MFIAALFVLAKLWKYPKTNRRMDKEIVTYPYNGTLLSNSKE